MKKKSNIKKFRKRKSINVGHIVFLIIFLYIFISVYLYFTKEHLTIYEVRKGSIAKDTIFNGLIIREEEVQNTSMAGYVYYYYKDGDRVPKNSLVYSIDENQSNTTLIDSELDNSILNKEEIYKIKKEISSFQQNYDNSNYLTSYDFKYNLNNASLDIMNEQKQSFLREQESSSDNTYFQVVNSVLSGIITYYTDELEGLLAEDIRYEHFELENYNKTSLRKNEIYEANAPVYKIVTDNTWNIIIPLKEEQYNYFINKSSESDYLVNIRFRNEGIESSGNLSCFKNGQEFFGKITLDSYMEKFVNQRFVEIELQVDKNTGLKVPNSAIIDKEFYKVPHEFFSHGGDTDSLGVILEGVDENDELTMTFVSTEIYYEDENYAYINSLIFEPNSRILSVTNKDLRLSEKDTLKGVYNVNKGFAIFRRIEIIEEGQEYTIVKDGTSYGISDYDQIALIGDTAIEQQIIY